MKTLRHAASSMLIVLGVALAAGSAIAQESVIEGVVRDAANEPVEGYRVIVREVDGTLVHVSPPSDAEGRYRLVVTAGKSYRVQALVSPTGDRIAVPEPPDVTAAEGSVEQDIRLPMAMVEDPRNGERRPDPDRLFLSFVEDAALPAHVYVELGVETLDFDDGDQFALRGVAAAQFAGLPRVEFGVRGGFADLEAGTVDDSGALDFEAWGKHRFYESSSRRASVAAGVLATLPTGDADVGLGADALQSKLFVAGSYSLAHAVVVAHGGLRTTEDGEIFGVPLDGTVSGTGGVAAVVPFEGINLSLVFEVAAEGERFEDAGSRSSALFGADWRIGQRGRLRGAAAAGLDDDSPDLELRFGYAFTF
jgi:hypothetical protein